MFIGWLVHHLIGHKFNVPYQAIVSYIPHNKSYSINLIVGFPFLWLLQHHQNFYLWQRANASISETRLKLTHHMHKGWNGHFSPDRASREQVGKKWPFIRTKERACVHSGILKTTMYGLWFFSFYRTNFPLWWNVVHAWSRWLPSWLIQKLKIRRMVLQT